MSLKKILFWSTSRSLTYLDWPYDFHTLPGSNAGREKPAKPTRAFGSESNIHFWPKDQTRRKADSQLPHFHQYKATKLLAQLKQSQCCTSCTLFFHLKSFTVLVCKNSEPDPQSASDLVEQNSCTIPLSCSKTPTLFHLFGPSTSLKYHKFQTGSTAIFYNFPEDTETAWLLVGIIYIL